ncbi:MAG: hypothetical protein KIT33_09575 [Candidatus Kapabacteria bacterium]|nr:hypothetical protein [Ignavibacteriota bacterium]MCW5885206.1 hypothetical protein [Candidatus Kapabacteria bacterium]
MSKHYSPVILVLLIFAGILLNNSLLKADYCEPKYSNAGIYMGIDYVQIGNMENSSDWASSGYTYYSNKVVDMKPGDEIEFFVEFGYTYEMELAIWVDWNGDDKFDTKTELAYGTYDGLSWEGYKGSFVVPDDVSFGTTRMRVMTEYSYMNYPYQYPADPCGTSYYYGEAEDYVVNIAPNAPDASITALTNPMNLFRVGNHDINVTLSSNNKAPLESVYIDWWINDVKQETYFWKGKLGENQTTSINLANVNLDYPANGPFNAFNMRFQVRNANDFEVDANPDNDVYTVNRTPVLNDAGVVGFF